MNRNLIFLTAGCALALSGCTDTERMLELEKSILELNTQAEKAQRETDRLHSRIEELEKEIETKEEEKERLSRKLDELEASKKALQENFDRYREEFRTSAQQRAIGTEIPEMRIAGRMIPGGTVRRFDGERVVVANDSGIRSLRLAELPADLQKELGFDGRTQSPPPPVPSPPSRASSQSPSHTAQRSQLLQYQIEQSNRRKLAQAKSDRSALEKERGQLQATVRGLYRNLEAKENDWRREIVYDKTIKTSDAMKTRYRANVNRAIANAEARLSEIDTKLREVNALIRSY